ncbi:MAG: 5-(carboxyamino)imidazole ribonucleotide mutase [Thermotogae bacterium]|nr:5-(carboxyamino)imidazole ribonucleotide mutase [Thermotogota bacterium]
MPDVALIMGSKSDLEVVVPAIKLLRQLEVSLDVKVLSAHRTPRELDEYLESIKNNVKVIIAAAGGAAHLPGVVAAKVSVPVIGLPIKSKDLNGLDSLLSIAQMPEGVPVATVGINRAKNAAILALEILALSNEKLRVTLNEVREEQKRKVLASEVNVDEI